MTTKMQTKIINLFGGPGCGKSTTACGLFYLLKTSGYKVELAHEQAKEFCYEERAKALACQPYVFGKQLMKLERLIGQVEYIVTDSPVLLSAVYSTPQYGELFKAGVIEIFNSMNNVNFFLKRSKPYQKYGRTQTEEEAVVIDERVSALLKFYEVPFITINGTGKDSINQIIAHLQTDGDKTINRS